jgi:hypothetical protein
VKSERIPSFLTHYYEAERGPFKNVCDLSDGDLDHLIAAEKDAGMAFNRFALGKDFFKIRRAADDLLIEKYREKFGVKPAGRPFYAVLGSLIGRCQCTEMVEASDLIFLSSLANK